MVANQQINYLLKECTLITHIRTYMCEYVRVYVYVYIDTHKYTHTHRYIFFNLQITKSLSNLRFDANLSRKKIQLYRMQSRPDESN